MNLAPGRSQDVVVRSVRMEQKFYCSGEKPNNVALLKLLLDGRPMGVALIEHITRQSIYLCLLVGLFVCLKHKQRTLDIATDLDRPSEADCSS